MELIQETILPLKSINKLNSIFYVLILIFYSMNCLKPHKIFKKTHSKNYAIAIKCSETTNLVH